VSGITRPSQIRSRLVATGPLASSWATFDTYGHLFPGSRDDVRERMDAYLGAAQTRDLGQGNVPADATETAPGL
jgi:hypothetical protein